MKANHDKVKKVINAMREDAISASSLGISNKYRFDTFCRENHIFKDNATYRGDDVLISCPFHSDSTASCHINDSRWIYNCFGCKGGNFLDFRFRYFTEILGEQITWYQMIDRMLRDDASLCSRLGFHTIFDNETKQIMEFSNFKRKRFKATQQMPKSYLEMVDKFMSLHPSVEQKKLFILMMQQGVPAKDAWNEFFGDKEPIMSDKKEYDLSKMDIFE